MAGKTKARKRGNGEGTVFFNQSKNLWVAQYLVNQKRKTIYAKTKTEVRAKLIKEQNSINEGLYIEPNKTKVGDWLNIWLKTYIIGKKAPKTAECYSNAIKNHIMPIIGNVIIKDLQAIQVQQLYNSVEKKCSARMAKLVHVTLHSSLKQAVMNDMLQVNVTEKCVAPKYAPEKVRALILEEQRIFVQAIKGNKFELAFLLCLYGGLRRGEVLALKWEDVNIETSTLDINKAVIRVSCLDAIRNEPKTRIMFTAPKSKSGNRSVPIPKELIPMIRQHKVKTAKEKLLAGNLYVDNDLLFCDSVGALIAPDSFNKAFKNVTRGLLDSKVKLHTLRHTYATRGAEQGVSIKVMQELLGHSDISVTSNIYTHISSDLKKQEVAKMSVILG